MMQLATHNLSQLLDEIAAMIAADRPIAAGLFELSDRSLGRFGRVAKGLAKRLQAGESPGNAIASISGNASPQVSAAFELVQRSGSAAPIRSVARSLRTHSETQTQLAIALVYPVITLCIAYFIVTLVIPWFVLCNSHVELGTPSIHPQVLAALQFMREHFWLPPLVLGLLALAWFLYVHFSSTRVWFSRSRADARWALFCDLLALHVEAGTPMSDAVAAAAKVSGDASFSDRVTRAVSERAESAFLPPMLRWSLSRLNGATGGGESIGDPALELRLLGDWYREQSLSRQRFWIDWFPVLVSIFVMTTVIIVVLLVTILPLYRHLSELM